MRRTLLSLTGLCFTAMLLAGNGCPLIPSIEEKIVQLAAGGSVIFQYHAEGLINDKDQTECFNFADELDLLQILDDAGIDVEDVIEILLSGVSYRVVVPDPEPTRTIVANSVTIYEQGDATQTALVTGFSDEAGVAYDFRTADLNPAGVALINQWLAQILSDIQTGQNPSLNVCAFWDGNSLPESENTDFMWQMKADITIVGEITVDAPE